MVSDDIKVLVHHGHVTLEGKVEWHYLREFAERDEAQQTAWSAPGVVRVKNEITVGIT